MARIVLCRHGETDHNARGRFVSTDDPALNAAGRAQCARLREALREFALESCIVSPMRRAMETCEIVAPGIPFEIDAALCEVRFGSWEGKTIDWLERHDPEGLAERHRNPVAFRPPGGESFADLATRLRPLVEKVRQRDATLVIGHRGSLGVLERLLRRHPLDSQAVKPLEPAEFHVIDEDQS